MSRTIFHRIFILSLLLISLSAQATGYKYAHGYINLSGDSPRVYVFKNKSSQSIILDRHLHFNPGMNAGWSTQVDSGKWSALNINISPFTMSCVAKTKNRYTPVCCKQYIEVLLVKSKSVGDGSFWVAENKSCPELKKRAAGRGIQLKSLRCG